MVKKIYFDMDGVLADFDSGVIKLCGAKPVKQGEKHSEEEEDLIWEKIRSIEHFYDKLEPMEGALELFKVLYEKYGSKCEILTGIPKPRRGVVTAAEDKVAWSHRLFSKDLVVNTVFKEEKKDFCTGKDCILIDDLKRNIAEWEAAGGTGILHKSAADTMECLKKLSIL